MRFALVSALLVAAACATDAHHPAPALRQEVPRGSAVDAVLVPHASWTCGWPEGLPAPRAGIPAFTADLEVAERYAVGETQYGQRTLRRFGAGTFTGAALDARLTPGGFEQHLLLANGAVELEQVMVLRGRGGAFIYLRLCGLAADADGTVRVALDFEAASDGPHAALNGAKLVGERRVSADGSKVVLDVFDVATVAVTGPQVFVENPAGVRDQRWDCASHTAAPGTALFSEVVALGAWQTVGAGKRGFRNIIPITGGTTSAPVAGKILPLGADHQIITESFYLDARYAAQTREGDVILIRNCGDMLALVPTFETRTDGKYAYLNDGKYRSSMPLPGLGVVNITIFGTE